MNHKLLQIVNTLLANVIDMETEFEEFEDAYLQQVTKAQEK